MIYLVTQFPNMNVMFVLALYVSTLRSYTTLFISNLCFHSFESISYNKLYYSSHNLKVKDETCKVNKI